MVFFRDMVLPIKHIENWKLIRHRMQVQMNYDNKCENKNIVDHNYQVGGRFMLKNIALKIGNPI